MSISGSSSIHRETGFGESDRRPRSATTCNQSRFVPTHARFVTFPVSGASTPLLASLLAH